MEEVGGVYRAGDETGGDHFRIAPWAGGQLGLGQERPPGKGGWELGLRSGRPRLG